ncbi:hypothetical protein AN958_00677 [Leucoagaricus sp. SymC.cos]|nr:hypothetical protein AN958_00677 [Leucoagaricus sp. SymC.cos]
MEYLAERLTRMRSVRNQQRGQRAGESSRIGETISRIRTGTSSPARRRNGENSSGTQSAPTAPPRAFRPPSARRPVEDSLTVSSLFPRGAVAKLDFEPERPDELPVSAGDYLKVCALYDDGWALCRNNFGGKGMVPTTCLRVNDVRQVG